MIERHNCMAPTEPQNQTHLRKLSVMARTPGGLFLMPDEGVDQAK